MTNETKQTAVEWLHQEMLKGILSMKEILEQAKEMEKEQIVDALNIGYYQAFDRQYENAEQYYNETYGGNK